MHLDPDFERLLTATMVKGVAGVFVSLNQETLSSFCRATASAALARPASLRTDRVLPYSRTRPIVGSPGERWIENAHTRRATPPNGHHRASGARLERQTRHCLAVGEWRDRAYACGATCSILGWTFVPRRLRSTERGPAKIPRCKAIRRLVRRQDLNSWR